MAGLRLAFVSAFPPGTGPLSEYAWHLVDGLRHNPRLEKLWILSDRSAEACPRSDGRVEVIPSWQFDRATYPLAVLRALRARPVDVVWFNLHMTATGNSRASWCAGLMAPALARAAGYKVMVTLHNMLGLTALERAGFRARPWDVFAANTLTRVLCRAHAICTLRPEYVRLLNERYGARHAMHVPMGAIGPIDTSPSPRRPGEILVFGHFGTYKRLETTIDAVFQLNRQGVAARLIIGGTDSRHSPGYLSSLRDRYAASGIVDFLGYVEEENVPSLFRRAQVCVLPYSTVTGMSSVAVQAATHGLPIVASDIPAFRTLNAEGLRMEFFREEGAGDLARVLTRFMAAAGEQERQRQANFAYVLSQPMAAVGNRYLDVAEALVNRVRAPQHAPDSLTGSARRPAA